VVVTVTGILEQGGPDFFNTNFQFTLDLLSNSGRNYYPHEVMSFVIPKNLNCFCGDDTSQGPNGMIALNPTAVL
jgi:hypothetical protein